MPYELFITNYATLPEALDLIYSRIRPAATFGEPSYLGFVLSSLLVVVLKAYEKSWFKNGMILCVLVTVYLCMSASGQFAVFLLLLTNFMQSDVKVGNKILLLSAGGLVLIVSWAAFSSFSTVERFSNIFDKKKEASGYYRLAAPAGVVGQVLLNSPIGVTNSELGKFIVSTKEMSRRDLFGALSTGFYNLFINYGVSGFLLMGLLLRPLWKDWLLMVYLSLSTFFNGAFLAFDKSSIVVASLCMAFYFSSELKNKSIKQNV